MLAGNYIMAQTQRTVLLEEFTQASCPHCPPANAYLNPLLAANTGKVVAIKYQVDFPGVDTMNLQDPADPNTRATLYGVYNIGVPDVVFDGDTNNLIDAHYTGYPYDVTQALINNELAVPSPVFMSATYSFNSATDSVYSTIVVKNVSGSTITSTVAGSLRLFISLVEMNIHFSVDPPGNNGEYDFYYVNRKMYPSANGFALPNTFLNGDSVIYHLAVKAPGYIYNTKEMAVAAFVQDLRSPTKMVDQAILATPSNVTDNILTDNTTYPASTEVCDVTFTPSVTLTNNGTITLTSASVGYDIPGSAPVSQPWTGSLAPGANTTISLNPVTVPDNTYGTLDYFVNNLNGGTLVDINDANNSPQSSFISTVPAVATMDSISEQFEEGIQFSTFTPISTNSNDAAGAFGFVMDLSYLNNYIDNTTGNVPVGGYAQSDASFFFCLACAQSGSQDALIFDKVDKASYDENLLTFQHAYAGIASSNDRLDVQISTDCGNTWITAWTKSGSSLATSPSVNIQTALFSPTALQWKTDSVDVSAYNHVNGVIVKFLATDAGGNAMYIDNINWAQGVSSVGIHDLSNSVSATVYPNPANKAVNLSLSLNQAANFEISVVDVLGQTVKMVPAGQLSGNTNIEVNVADLASGAYNFVIKSNDQILVKRFFVTK